MLKKYGRTFHLPGSPGATKDDRVMGDLAVLRAASEVVVTEKMDGENTTIHASGTHPRSPDARYHPSRDWTKAFAAGISPHLNVTERVVGEYLYARHSVPYDALSSYFLGFAWSIDGVFQSWDDTVARFESLGIQPVPVLARGAFSGPFMEAVLEGLDPSRQEGCVVRVADALSEADMPTHMGKYVRADHVQSEIHWMQAELHRNGLAGS